MANVFNDPESRQELITRVTKILHYTNSDDLEVDKMKLEGSQFDIDDPFFVAAECFRETLIEIGVDEVSAETARATFLALKRTKMEDTQNHIRKIASRLQAKRPASEDLVQEINYLEEVKNQNDEAYIFENYNEPISVVSGEDDAEK